ncbi:Chitin synthase 4 [Batrachochytrium dendrobatidis]
MAIADYFPSKTPAKESHQAVNTAAHKSENSQCATEATISVALPTLSAHSQAAEFVSVDNIIHIVTENSNPDPRLQQPSKNISLLEESMTNEGLLDNILDATPGDTAISTQSILNHAFDTLALSDTDLSLGASIPFNTDMNRSHVSDCKSIESIVPQSDSIDQESDLICPLIHSHSKPASGRSSPFSSLPTVLRSAASSMTKSSRSSSTDSGHVSSTRSSSVSQSSLPNSIANGIHGIKNILSRVHSNFTNHEASESNLIDVATQDRSIPITDFPLDDSEKVFQSALEFKSKPILSNRFSFESRISEVWEPNSNPKVGSKSDSLLPELCSPSQSKDAIFSNSTTVEAEHNLSESRLQSASLTHSPPEPTPVFVSTPALTDTEHIAKSQKVQLAVNTSTADMDTSASSASSDLSVPPVPPKTDNYSVALSTSQETCSPVPTTSMAKTIQIDNGTTRASSMQLNEQQLHQYSGATWATPPVNSSYFQPYPPMPLKNEYFPAYPMFPQHMPLQPSAQIGPTISEPRFPQSGSVMHSAHTFQQMPWQTGPYASQLHPPIIPSPPIVSPIQNFTHQFIPQQHQNITMDRPTIDTEHMALGVVRSSSPVISPRCHSLPENKVRKSKPSNSQSSLSLVSTAPSLSKQASANFISPTVAQNSSTHQSQYPQPLAYPQEQWQMQQQQMLDYQQYQHMQYMHYLQYQQNLQRQLSEQSAGSDYLANTASPLLQPSPQPPMRQYHQQFKYTPSNSPQNNPFPQQINQSAVYVDKLPITAPSLGSINDHCDGRNADESYIPPIPEKTQPIQPVIMPSEIESTHVPLQNPISAASVHDSVVFNTPQSSPSYSTVENTDSVTAQDKQPIYPSTNCISSLTPATDLTQSPESVLKPTDMSILSSTLLSIPNFKLNLVGSSLSTSAISNEQFEMSKDQPLQRRVSLSKQELTIKPAPILLATPESTLNHHVSRAHTIARRASLDESTLKRTDCKPISPHPQADSEYGTDTENSENGTAFSSSASIGKVYRPQFATILRPNSNTTSQSDLATFNDTTLDEAAVLEYRERLKTSSDPRLQFDFAQLLVEKGEPYLDEGFLYLKKASAAGLSEAQCYLAQAFYDDGQLEAAYSQWLTAAKKMYPPACYQVARCSEQGRGTKKNYRFSLQMYTKAATIGHRPSMHRLGVAEMRGELGLKPDIRNAVRWFKRGAAGADKDTPHCLFELCEIFEKGALPHIMPDIYYARSVLIEASHLGFPPAQYKLGYCFEYGRLGCATNAAESIHLYSAAAATGYSEALFSLAGWYMTGAEGVLVKNERRAFELASGAAAQNLPRAQYTIGHFFEQGIGITANLEQAIIFYNKAAANGEERAIKRLSELAPAKHTAPAPNGKRRGLRIGFFGRK